MANIIYTAATIGVDAYKIEIETDVSKDSNKFNILGMKSYDILQSREKISRSLIKYGCDLRNYKTIVNLYPYYGSTRSNFDLPIAINILMTTKDLFIEPRFLKETIIIGGLSLEGKIRPVKGILPIAFAAKSMKIKRLVLPLENASEAAHIKDLEVIAVDSIDQFLKYINKEIAILPTKPTIITTTNNFNVDFSDIKGHQQAKRAFQIAAAGRHNIIMVGTPGCGKTMLATRLKTIMPPLTNNEIIETSKIYSISNKNMDKDIILDMPYREPHHSASSIGLIGGGSLCEPGEISLAHNGILFMDEFAEFKRTALESLRQPLENQKITISRANQNITYPASFLLVAALNPCPCGFNGDLKKRCSCNSLMISNYFDKISGPLLDRIDIQLTLNSVDISTIQNTEKSISSADLKKSILIANSIQMKRQKIHNGLMTAKDIDKYCILTDNAKNILKLAFEKLNMSSRSYHKIIKISRTIADLDEKKVIDIEHVKEALMYRSLEKKFKN